MNTSLFIARESIWPWRLRGFGADLTCICDVRKQGLWQGRWRMEMTNGGQRLGRWFSAAADLA